VFAVIELGINAYFLSLTAPRYFIFSVLGMATSLLTILTVPIMYVCLCLVTLFSLKYSQADRRFHATWGVHVDDCRRTRVALYAVYVEMICNILIFMCSHSLGSVGRHCWGSCLYIQLLFPSRLHLCDHRCVYYRLTFISC
jgi:hypothetical protein